MNTLAQQYLSDLDKDDISNDQMISISRDAMADLWANNSYVWIVFCDDSVLSSHYGEGKAYKHLMPFHKNGVTY